MNRKGLFARNDFISIIVTLTGGTLFLTSLVANSIPVLPGNVTLVKVTGIESLGVDGP